MTEEYEAPISLKMVKKILEERYTQEYKPFGNVSVEICPRLRTYAYSDWDYPRSYTYYDFEVEISFVKKVGILSMNGSFNKNYEELNNDLVEELRKLCKDDEYVISSVRFPRRSKRGRNANVIMIQYFMYSIS